MTMILHLLHQRLSSPDSQFLYGKMTSASRNKSGSYGGMAERLKAHVLKTCLGHTNVGSNPTPSAEGCMIECRRLEDLFSTSCATPT